MAHPSEDLMARHTNACFSNATMDNCETIDLQISIQATEQHLIC